jgi:hypothetical protein
MKSQIKQILRQFCLLNHRLSFAEKIIYSFLILVLAQAILLTIDKGLKFAENYIIENYKTFFLYLLGGLLFGLGFYLLIFQIRRNKKNSDSSLTDDDDDEDNINDNTTGNHLTVYTEGGNYNESIHGDYIEIQGNYININQDFSDVATEIRELIEQLKTQGYSEEHAETIVASELAEQARIKSKVRKKLFKWIKIFRGATAKVNYGNDETEAAREVVKNAATYSYTSSTYFTEVVGGNFQKLEELLHAKKWKEADLETAKIIYVLSQRELPDSSPYGSLSNYFSDSHVAVLPKKDLNTINNLWVKHSNGRFGFSVQKQIWKSLKSQSNYYSYDTQQKFGNIVGWRKEDDWIYYADINYSRTAVPGHLPLIVLLSSSATQRCRINFSIFQVFVGRIYIKL